jgi:pimeloyl-ACP methyl ester carboxylesterase
LSSKVAFRSDADAGCEVEIRQLPGVGHFVDLEAPDKLAQEFARLF